MHDTAAIVAESGSPSSIDPVAHSRGDESDVHDTAVVVAKKKLVVSSPSQFSFSHVPVLWGKLTKVTVLNVFEDAHTGLGTLGPPLHISTNRSVTPVQAHPHRCPMAKEAKEAEAIRDPEGQGILQKVSELTAWITNSGLREKPDGRIRVCIDPTNHQ